MLGVQLSQVEQAVTAAGETEELQKLVIDLKELISLTEGIVVSLTERCAVNMLCGHIFISPARRLLSLSDTSYQSLRIVYIS